MSDPIIYAGTGTTTGTGADDTIHGTSGNDNIYGRDGDDVILGFDGQDSTRGEGGSDSLYGGGGNDFLDGGTGDDLMEGGGGNDTYIVDSAGDAVVELDGEGTDTVRSLIASYTLPEFVESLDLASGDGIAGAGNALDNSVRGNALGNALSGLGGSDRLNGEGGDDLLVGGAGVLDLLLGGAGADRFEFAAADSAAQNAADNIGDLDFGEGDTIALLGLGAGGADVALSSYQEVYEYIRDMPGVAAATTSSGRLILTIPNGARTQVINVTASDAWSQFQAANPDPVAADDSATTDEDTSVLVDVLVNDTDDTALTLVSPTTAPGQGAVTIESGQLRFDPGADFDYLAAGASTVVAVTYEVRDQFGKTATATLSVTVTGVNEGAVIGGTDTGCVVEDKDIFAHGKLTIDDPDGPDTFKPGIYAGEWGFVVLLSNGTWVYTLNVFDPDLDQLDTGESVVDSVTIRAVDGTEHAIAITVKGTTDKPCGPADCDRTDDPNNNDAYSGGSLFSSLSSSQLNSANTLRGTGNSDCIDAKNGNDVVYAKAGNDTVDGGQGNDTVYGGSGADKLDGKEGDDRLYGGSGSDRIDGGQGNDTIVGGFGDDTLTGGQGNDRFVFLGACDTNDEICDFTRGQDKIDLSAFQVNGIDFTFDAPVQSDVFSAGHNLIWFRSGGATIVMGDTDGDFSTAEFMLTLNGTYNLASTDFLI